MMYDSEKTKDKHHHTKDSNFKEIEHYTELIIELLGLSTQSSLTR